jgi:hypothetical protein
MSELQTMRAVGQVAEPDSSNYRHRTVTYTVYDRKITVTFANDTQFQEASSHALGCRKTYLRYGDSRYVQGDAALRARKPCRSQPTRDYPQPPNYLEATIVHCP